MCTSLLNLPFLSFLPSPYFFIVVNKIFYPNCLFGRGIRQRVRRYEDFFRLVKTYFPFPFTWL